jgi:hypothetical protein
MQAWLDQHVGPDSYWMKSGGCLCAVELTRAEGLRTRREPPTKGSIALVYRSRAGRRYLGDLLILSIATRTMRSQRSAARKVSVRQRCGTLAASLWPRGAQPRRGVIFVLAQVSSMKTSRLGSSRP